MHHYFGFFIFLKEKFPSFNRTKAHYRKTGFLIKNLLIAISIRTSILHKIILVPRKYDNKKFEK
jgi:hypothetical protein